MRVVSFNPSGSEILAGLGLAKTLVGRSHECDYPPSILDVPVVSETTLDASRPSAEIDLQVREKIKFGQPLFSINTDLLRKLQPDLVLSQSHCDVCALGVDQLRRFCVSEKLGGIRVVDLGANEMAGLFEDIRTVAEAVGRPDQGAVLNEALASRLECVRRANQECGGITVAFIEWLEPLMIGGNWIPEMIEIAGGLPILSSRGVYSSFQTMEAIREADPALIVIAPCGFDVARTESELSTLFRQSLWPELRAVQSGNVFVADGNAYFNRSGPRLVDSVEMLSDMIRGVDKDHGVGAIRWKRL